jgi:hypothetical protein
MDMFLEINLVFEPLFTSSDDAFMNFSVQMLLENVTFEPTEFLGRDIEDFAPFP